MITLRSRTISIVLTFMMVFTTVFGNASLAFADTAETGTDVPTTVEQDIHDHEHDADAATEEGGAEDSTDATVTEPTDTPADVTQPEEQDTVVTEPADTTEPEPTETPAVEAVVEDEIETTNVDLAYTADEDDSNIQRAPTGGEIVFEYEDADGHKVEVTDEELEDAVNSDSVADGMDIPVGTEVTVTMTPDKDHYIFNYMAYLAGNEDAEVVMDIDNEDNQNWEVERKATFEVGEDDIVVEIMFDEVEADIEAEATEGDDAAKEDSDKPAKEEAATWAVEDGWYWEGSTLYIKDGQAIDLYTALTDDNGINLNPKAYDGGWKGSYDAEIKYAKSKPTVWTQGTTAGTQTIDEGTYLAVASNGRNSIYGKWTEEVSFTVRHYHAITVSLANGSPEDAGISLTEGETQIIYKDDSLTFTINKVDGYNVKVFVEGDANEVALDGLTEGETNYTFEYTPNASVNLVVKYEEVKLPATIDFGTIKGEGTVSFGKLTADGTLDEGNYELKVSPAAGNYVKSVKVNDQELTNGLTGFDALTFTNVYNVSSNTTYEIDVEFEKREIAENANPEAASWNQYYDDPSDRMDELKASIYSQLVASAPVGSTSYKVQVWTDGWTYEGVGIPAGWVTLDDGTYYTVDLLVTSVDISNEFMLDSTLGNPAKVRVVFEGDARYPEVITGEYTIAVDDSRTEPLVENYEYDGIKAFECDLEDESTEIISYIAGKVAATNNLPVGEVTVTRDSGEWPADGEDATGFAYKVKVASTENHQGAEFVISDFTITNEQHNVEPVVIPVDNADVVVDVTLDENGTAPKGTYTVEVTPDWADGYYINGITVQREGDETVEYLEGEYVDGVYTVDVALSVDDTTAVDKYFITPNVKKQVFTEDAKDAVTLGYNFVGEESDDSFKERLLKEVIDPQVDVTKYTISYEEFDKNTQEVTIPVTVTLTGNEQIPDVSKTVTVTLTHEKQEFKVAMDTIPETATVDGTYAELIEEIKAAVVTENGVEAERVTVELKDADQKAPLQGETLDVAFVITIAGNDWYKEATKEVVIEVTGATNLAVVTFAETENGTVTAVDSSNNAITAPIASDVITITATPAKNYYVKSIMVNGETVEMTHVEGTANFTAAYDIKDGTGEEAGVTPEYVISAEFAVAIEFNDEREFKHMPGQTIEDPEKFQEELWNAVVKNPPYNKDAGCKIEYLAREAGEYTINIPEIKFSIITLYEGGPLTIELEELWLEPGTELEYFDAEAEFERIKEIIAGIDSLESAKNALSELTTFIENLKTKPIGAHEFGALGLDNPEKLRVSYEDKQYIVTDAESDVTIRDPRIATEFAGSDATVVYGFTEEELIEALGLNIMAGDTVVDGKIIIRPAVKNLEASETPHEVTVVFEGDGTYQPCERTFNVTVNKAPASVAVTSGTYRYGEIPPSIGEMVVTTPAEAETLTIAAGLTVADVYQGEESTAPCIDVYVNIPGELGSLINSAVDGPISLSDFLDLLGTFSDSLGLDESIVENVEGILGGIGTEDLDIRVFLSDKTPTEIGLYLVGGVTIDSNYETAANVGYMAIHPDGYKTDIDWIVDEENGLVTLPHIQNGEYDLGAEVVSVAEPGTKEEATEKLMYVYMGVDENGEAVVKRTADPQDIGYGAYTQIAYIQDFGNTMYYADPIIRAFAVVPEAVTVEFTNGNPAEFTYDNTPKDMGVVAKDMDGIDLGTDNLTVKYIGIDANNIIDNGNFVAYNSTTPPTNAGAYSVIATYADEETGMYGMNIGAMTIAPAEATLTVEDRTMSFKDYQKDSGITVTENVEGDSAAYISMIAGIDFEGDFIEDGIGAVGATANIDFPSRIDAYLKQIMPSAYTTGISANEIINQTDKVAAKLEALGLDSESISVVVDFLNQLKDDTNMLGDVKITFKEFSEIAPQAAGIYLVGGVTCDPNYTMSADFGVLALAPEATEVELAFNVVDDNGIITNTLIKNGVYDMGSHVVKSDLTDEQYEAATKELHNLYIGVDKDGNLVKSTEASAELGLYTQIAFIADADPETYYAVPIMRTYMVVAESANVQFTDENDARRFTYSGYPQGMGAHVYTMDESAASREIANNIDESMASENLTVRYIGVDAKGMEIWNSTEEPTNAGAYTVVATYADDENEVYGMRIGAMTIEPAEATLAIDEYRGEYDADFSFSDMIHVTSGPQVTNPDAPAPEYISVVAGIEGDGKLLINGVDYANGVINVDFPEWMEPFVKDAFAEKYETGIMLEDLEVNLESLKEKALEYGFAEADIDELLNVVTQMANEMINGEIEIIVTFADLEDVKPVAKEGGYLLAGIVFDPNYIPETAAGYALITPDGVLADLEFVYPDKVKFDTVEAQNKELFEAEAWVLNEDGTRGETLGQDWIKHLYIGTTDAGESYSSTEPPTELGHYIQLTMVFDVENQMYISKPTMREFVIEKIDIEIDYEIENTEEAAENEFTVVYDGDVHAAVVNGIVSEYGEEVAYGADDVTITYTGNGLTDSTEAPVNAGTYNVTIKYAGNDTYKDKTIYATLTIEKRKVEYTVDNIEVGCNVTQAEYADALIAAVNYAEGSLEPVGTDVTVTVAAPDMKNSEPGTYKLIPTVTYAEGIENNYEVTVTEDATLTIGDHDMVKEVLDPTCTEEGYVKTYCANEGCPSLVTIDVLNALGHKPVVDEAVEATCTETGLTEGSHCDVCEEVLIPQEVVAEQGHNYGEWIKKQEATCVENGVEVRVCDRVFDGKPCLDVDSRDIEALGHKYVQTGTEPTCETAGYTTYTCEVCEDSYITDLVEAFGHKYVTERQDATCTEDGYHNVYCERCDIGTSDILPATGHKVVIDEAVDPTCTETGLTEGSHCVICGEVLIAQEVVEANGHTEVADAAVDPTCTETGLTEGSHCDICGEVLVEQTVVDALGHDYEAVVTEPTCTTTGFTTNTCTVCDDEYIGAIKDALGHDYVTVLAKDPTCTEAGNTAGITCNNCDLVVLQSEVIDAKGHVEVVDEAVAPTCEETGLTEGKHCAVCDEVLIAQEVVKANGHTEVADAAVAPTCTETGLTDGKHCDVCGKVLVEQTVVDALGHDYEAVVTEPTCTTTGFTTNTCTVCDDEYIDAIKDALGHDYIVKEAVDATCTTAGSTAGVYCSRGDKVLVESVVIPAKGHVEIVDAAVAPTCEETGLTEGKHCAVCNATIVAQDVVPATGHTDVVVDPAVAQTCTTSGLTEGSHCGICGDVIVEQEVIDADGHRITDKVHENPTCTEDGYTAYYCHCGFEMHREIHEETGHSFVVDSAVDPTCTETGKTIDVRCEDCDLIVIESEEIKAKDHTVVKDEAVEATCTETGLTEGSHCKVCDTVLVPQEVVDMIPHTLPEVDGKQPTCTEPGGTESATCTVCDKLLTKEEVIPALGHTVVTQESVAPTCEETGLTAGAYCKVCDTVLVEQKVVDALGHTPVEDPAVEPTETEDGLTAGSHCGTCGEVLEEQVVIPALGHDHTVVTDAAVEATCTTSGLTEGSHCETCGEVLVPQTVIDALGHEIVVDVEEDETCTTAGKTAGVHCGVCGEVLVAQEVIPAPGHNIVIDKAVDATCATAGLSEGAHCDVCHTVLVAQKELHKKAHTLVIDPAVEPTETTHGWTVGVHCGECGEVLVAQEVVPAKGHTHTVVTDAAVAATCTTTGLTEGSHCSACNAVLVKQEVVPTVDHTYTNEVTAPTCTEAGYTTYTCAVCGDTYKDTIVKANGHKYVTVDAVAATCTESGKTAGVHCAICDLVILKSEAIEAKGHNEVIILGVEPTETTAGKTEGKICADCGKVLVEQEIIPALGHKHTEVIDAAVKPTCTTTGLTEGKHCETCEKVLVKQEVVPALAHTYDEVVTEPTCTTAGYTTYTCECSDTYKDNIVAATGHTYTTETTEPTCTTAGYTTYTCECGHTYDDDFVNATGHDYVVVPEKDATCTEDGYTAKVYCECGEVILESEVIEATGHDEVIDEAVDATCEETGLTEGSHCADCGEVLVEQETVPANGHNEVIDEAADATETEPGKTEGSHCADCGEVLVEQEIIPAVGHKHTEVIDEVVDATCTLNGLTEGKHCETCGEILVEQEVIEATGHSYTETVTEPTCTEAGYTTYTCECGDNYKDDIVEAAGHDYVIVPAVDATCTEAGKTAEVYCGDCGEVILKSEVIEATGHKEVVDPAVDADCESTGLTEGKHCGTCDEVLAEQETVPAKGHNVVTDPAVDATETEAGKTEGKHCADCGEVLVKPETVPALGHKHTEVIDKAVEPTCTEAGLTEGKHCETCGEVLVKQEMVPANGHDYVIEKAVDATCTEAGKTAGVHCGDCDEVILKSEVIAATGHKVVIDPAVEPTETEAGLTEGKHCATCDEVLAKQEIVPALGHKHTEVIDKAVEPTCEETGLTEGKHCSACGEVIVKQEVVPAKGHNYGEEQYQAPTKDTDGGWFVICEDCGDKEWTKVQTWKDVVKADTEATAITAKAEGSQKTETIKVTWKNSSNAQITYYKVYRSTTGKAGSFSYIGKATAKSYEDKKATVGKTYYYKVIGYTELDGETFKTKTSNAASAKIKKVTASQVKATPMKGTTNYKHKAIQVMWTSPNIKVDGYEVHKSSSRNGKYKLVKTTKANVFTWTDTKNLKVGNRYFYKIRGFKYVNGKKVYTKFSSKGYRYVLKGENAKIARAIVRSDAITAKKAVKVKGGIKVTWSKKSSIKCNRYEVWRATSKNGTYTRIAKTKNKYYTDKSAKAGKTYYYKIVGFRYFGKANAKTNPSNIVSVKR